MLTEIEDCAQMQCQIIGKRHWLKEKIKCKCNARLLERDVDWNRRSRANELLDY